MLFAIMIEKSVIKLESAMSITKPKRYCRYKSLFFFYF